MKRLHFMDLLKYIAFTTILIFLISLFYMNDIRTYIEGNVTSSNLFIDFMIIFLIELMPQPIGPEIFVLSAFLQNIKIWVVLMFGFIAITITSIFNFNIGRFFYDKVCSDGRCDKQLNSFKKYDKYILLIASLGPVPYVPFCWISGSVNLPKKQFFLFGIMPRLIRLFLVTGFIYLF